MDKAFGLQNMELRGVLNTDIKANGVYDKKNNKIPVTNGTVSLKNGFVKTNYYPNPIRNINVMATVLDNEGSLRDLKINITPASFDFEGKPIYVNAKLQNFENIKYDIKAKGELDLARIYKVFSRKGLDLKGYVKADVSFKGSQNDAVKGHYSKLQNKGTMLLRNIKTTSEYLPKPFVIREGTFIFNQDKMNFNEFKATYGESDFRMNGFLQNVIDFVLTDKAVLKGVFSLQSTYIKCDEFMASTAPQAEAQKQAQEDKPVAKATETGVIVIPPNFDLQFSAKAGKVNFQDLILENVNGNMLINKGRLTMKNNSFDIIGSKVKMDIAYGSESANRASFDFKVNAKDFDVKRAYKEVKMFREMVTAAESAEGIISLDYKVAGKLDANMQPIYPSLAGGGTLSVKNVKMKGFRLFNAVSKKTGKDGIKNPDLSQVDIHTTIKNNIINIERFKFKVAGFRPRIEGQTSFDGKLNIKMRLGLPPLGIIGIPMKVTGTQENPKVSLGRKSEDLEETEYEQGQAPATTAVTPATK